MEGNMEVKPFGYEWRSSRWFIGSSITIALFTETFLYGFLIPLLAPMLEGRLGIDPSHTQSLTSALLTLHGFFGLVSAPIIAHFADKSSNKRAPLLIALGGCIVGTLLIALTPSLWALFLGRVLQSVAGSGAWVIGLALLTDSVPGEQLGKVLGFAMSFVSAGILSGPLIAGTVYELAGYWTAWSIPCTIMVLDIIARLIMIEPRDYSRLSPSPLKPNYSSSAEENGQAGEAIQPEETTPLLPNADTSRDGTAGHGFYSIMFSDMRVITGLTSMLLTSILMSSLNNTLPVHLRDIFGWGTMPTGLMFLCLQLPSILCGGLFGAIRDRYGLKIPTTAGWLLCTPVIFCLGIPGLDTFPWAGKDAAGEHMFVGCILAFGMTSLLVRGAGPVQLTCVARDMQAKYPHVFGENGGSSRVFSMTEVAYSLGMMLGPLLSGILFETVGFSLMAIVFAAMCVILAIMSLVWLDGQNPSGSESSQ